MLYRYNLKFCKDIFRWLYIKFFFDKIFEKRGARDERI